MKSRNKGISLIVLVITIIVIIILAGAVLLSLSQNNPINQASEATFKQDIGEYKSELALYIVNQYATSGGSFNVNLLNKTGTDIKTVITSMKDTDTTKFAIEKGQLVYLDSMNDIEKTYSQDVGLNPAGVTPYTKANAAVDESTTVTPLTENSTIDGQNPTYSDPIIPAGFHAVNTATSWSNLSTDWNNGLVIQDTAGNQFVWVPVDGTNVTYAKWCTTGTSYNDLNISDDMLPESYTAGQFNTINTKYGGFYIGRYEASFDYNGGSIRVREKKSTNCTVTDWSTTRNNTYTGYLWNYINCTDSQNYANSMDTSYGYDTTKLGTNLVTGTQWDTTMKWIQNAGIDVAADGSAWGNYYNSTFTYDYPTNGTKALNTSTLLNTGATSRNSSKNIYDLAGNVWEWTNEKYSTSSVFRGGRYNDFGSGNSAGFRNYSVASGSGNYLGFRLALYVK